ncbi:serine/threonine protein kinase with two-component sensor domain [Calothrix sp. NIES-2100]|uniref:trifunctional serine/threonine-protein kinase/ATP-binding protein/sensor histidine kinase n=1 Tax=Calothrix sp. NIES-2100 TaxID=1954172 RepID=UPI000B5E0FEB|nr:serine/threonine protein kinase with two-component sensor domain [Calothrix sp. NIES-2100]
MSITSQIPSIPGYQISSQLYAGSRTKVYRAIREQETLAVVIKLLTSEYPSFNELLQFRNQYTISKNLNIPGIIHPLSLESYGNGYILVMEDRGEVSLREYIKNTTLSLIEFLTIAIQLTNLLHCLHQSRVIHKDIKPANILIHPQTKQVQLIDFSIASLLPKETQEIKSPNVLEGTLAYIAPEQTGRMNRGIDYRSDFYSLGVTFYELLTGELPFISDDPIELVHCHIAKQAPKPEGKREEIPQVLGDMISKLMAKNAEDRYQSALGLKYDLETCLYQLKDTGKIINFEICQRDVCDRFLIAEKLYGREKEVTTLLQAFERVANGTSEMMLVAGFSGIGKTAVVNEVHKPITRQQGYFIKGKFDQFNRNIPLSAFVQALRDLMEQLLTESDTHLALWKTKILAAVGENGQVLIEVIPELELIIDRQPPVPELSGTAAQNRFNLLFQKFIAVFTIPKHPLVMFLDDLQWADSASLVLMKLLMQDNSYLLLLGAYRDNEVQAAHPFILTVEELKKAQKTINTITLLPLTLSDTNQLVADTLHCPTERSRPLTELIDRKTQGNPFFITQFLKALHEDGQIKFTPPTPPYKGGATGGWECDITQIHALSLTDNVVEFMAQQLQKLPSETQQVLKLAACIGNQFDLATLAIVWEQSQADAADALWKALQEGLILPQSQVYKFYLNSDRVDGNTSNSENVAYRFLHDRVQQAAYSLIPEDQKQSTHYQIGQLLLQKISKEVRVDRIFEVVNQLNYGTALITEQKERDELAQLNLIACRKAKSATAYQAAREYANTGLSILGKNAWQRQYEISLEFHDLAAELAWLGGDFAAMEQFIDTVIKQTHSLLEQINVYRIKIQSNVSRNQLHTAITIGQQVLQQLGITFPETPTKNDIQQEIADIEQLIGDREIADCVHLPMMTDGEKIAILRITSSIMPAAYLSGSPFHPLLVCLSVKLSIQYGNTSASAHSYASYGNIACNMQHDVETGVKFGQLALAVVSKLDAKAVKPGVLLTAAIFIVHRKSHLKEILPLLQENYTSALEVGNQEYAGYNAQAFCFHSFWCSQPLATLEQETRAYCNGLVQMNQLTTANNCRIYWQSMLNLLQGTEHPSTLSGEVLQEAEFLPLLISAHNFSGLYNFHLYKLMLCYLFGEIESAKSHAIEDKRYLMAARGMFSEAVFYFYDSLIALAQLSPKSPETSAALARVEQNQSHLQQHWAHYARMNHQHKLDLVAAEKCRVLGQNAEAIKLYDKAIAGAKTNEYIQEEALANELAAKFYLAWGKEKVASGYMQQAYYCYTRWGAKAKVAHLEQQYPQLLTPILQQTNFAIASDATISSTLMRRVTKSSSSQDLWLDFPAVMKAAQAISQEIELEKLLATLMQIAIANAGAQIGHLVLRQDEQWLIVAQADQQRAKTLEIPLDQSQELPQSLIYTVARTQETAVFENLSKAAQFAGDRYIIIHQPKSALCTPISRQGKLVGILYLENNLTVGAFSRDRIEILQLLTSQAAISLENARLYQQTENYSHTLEAEVELKTQALNLKAQDLEQTLKKLQQTQAQLIQSEKMSSLGQLVAGIAHEINNPVSFIKGNLTHTESYIEDMMRLLTLYQQEYPQPSPAIQAMSEEIDLDFLFEDVNQILESMKVGSDRISQIVLSLRNFSRLDEAEIKAVDLHSGMESTLLILQNRLQASENKPEIRVVKEYGNLPLVTCSPSQLNQVFLNIINNAIDAIRDHPQSSENSEIRIRTEMIDSERLRIAIANTDSTIPESIQDRIFDPFFTTKPIGRGTGLGLFVSYSIIQQHDGTLTVRSHPAEGTEFEIMLPIR